MCFLVDSFYIVIQPNWNLVNEKKRYGIKKPFTLGKYELSEHKHYTVVKYEEVLFRQKTELQKMVMFTEKQVNFCYFNALVIYF